MTMEKSWRKIKIKIINGRMSRGLSIWKWKDLKIIGRMSRGLSIWKWKDLIIIITRRSIVQEQLIGLSIFINIKNYIKTLETVEKC